MDQLEIDIQKGKQAEAKLSDPLFIESMQRIKQDQWVTIMNTQPKDTEGREKAYFMLKAVEALELELSRIVSAGTMAKNKLPRGAK